MHKDLEKQLRNGFSDYYENADTKSRLDAAIQSLNDLNCKRIELNRLTRLIEDSIYYNAASIQYVDGYATEYIKDFCDNWHRWKSKSLTSAMHHQMNREYRIILDKIFGGPRKYSVGLYNVVFGGYNKMRYLMYFTIAGKYTLMIEIPNYKVCSINQVSEYNYLRCMVCATKEKYNKDTNYFKWDFNKCEYSLDQLVSDAIKFLGY